MSEKAIKTDVVDEVKVDDAGTMTVKEPDAKDTKPVAEAKARRGRPAAKEEPVVEEGEIVEKKPAKAEKKKLGFKVVGNNILVKKVTPAPLASGLVLPTNNFVQEVEVVQVGDVERKLSVDEGDRLFLTRGIDAGSSKAFVHEGQNYYVISPDDVAVVLD